MKYLEARDRAGVFAGHAFEGTSSIGERRGQVTVCLPSGQSAWLPYVAYRLVGHRPNTAAIRLRRPTIVPCHVFAAADGHTMVAVGNDGLCSAVADVADLRPPRDGSPLRRHRS